MSRFKSHDKDKSLPENESLRAYKGIFQLLLFTGHSGPNAIKQCEALIKCLSGYRDAYREFLDREFPAQLREELVQLMGEVKEAMKGFLPEKQFKALEQMLDSVNEAEIEE
jgi:hypothetical protein